MRKCLSELSHSPPFGFEEWAYATISSPSLRITSRGRNLYGDCPFCGKTRSHFSINLDNGLYKCYICGDGRGNLGGSWADLVTRIERIPFSKVSDFLLNKISTQTVWELPPTKEETPEEKVDYSCLVGTVGISSEEEIACKGREYLLSRGISEGVASTLRIRVGVYGKYKNRVIIPLVENKNVINFVARDLTGKGLRYTGPKSVEGWVPKSECLFNIDNIKTGAHLLIVEGIFDAIPLFHLDVVAILGKSLSDTQLVKILNLNPQSVTVVLDGDESEKGKLLNNSAKRVAKRFYALVPEVKSALMPQGVDPSDDWVIAEYVAQNAEVLV